MGQWDFYNEFKELCEYYNSDIYKNKKITKLYYEKVKSMSLDEFKQLCVNIIKEFKFMPKVADMSDSGANRVRSRTYTEEFLSQFYET